MTFLRRARLVCHLKPDTFPLLTLDCQLSTIDFQLLPPVLA